MSRLSLVASFAFCVSMVGAASSGRADDAKSKKPMMKTFLDVHHGLPKGLPEAATAAEHKKDLDAEKRHPNVHFTRSYYDSAAGVVYCGCQAPTKEDCEAVHKEAGHPADEIHEVREQ